MPERVIQRSRAFPNAYLETDEPPRGLPWKKIIAVAGALGTTYFGLTILALSLLDADYSPISQAASDYGVGRFALEMNLGFFIGGIGLITFASSIGRKSAVLRSRAGSVLFFIASLMLFMDSYFTTNIEGGPATLHGTFHGFGGLVFFIAAPLGVILFSRKIGRAPLLAVTGGLIIGFSLLAFDPGLSGLAERVILLVIFSTVVFGSLEIAGILGIPSA